MSKIDTMNSKSNFDCIADELFTELTSEASAVIEGGWNMHLYSEFNGVNPIAGANERLPELVFDNQAKSITIESGEWTLYDGKNFTGERLTLGPGYWNLFDTEGNDFWVNRVSSIEKTG